MNVLYLCSRVTVGKISSMKPYIIFFDGYEMPPTTLSTPALSWTDDLVYSFKNVLKCGNNILLITHTHTFLLSPVIKAALRQ